MDAEKLKELLSYDPKTGNFTSRIDRGKLKKGAAVGHKCKRLGYIRIMIYRKMYLAHRLAWVMTNGKWPPHEIDHINGDPSDNRLSNLRLATHSQNMRNRKARGVVREKNRWRARIKINGKKLHIGSYASEHEARIAYNNAEKQYFGEFASCVCREQFGQTE